MSTQPTADNTSKPVSVPQGPQGVDKDPEEDKPGAPGSDFTKEQKGKKVDADPANPDDKPVE